MQYFIDTDGKYILSYGIGENGGTKIPKEQYEDIIHAVELMPEDAKDISYRLKLDLSYEKTPITQVDPDIDYEEIFNILMGEE